MPEAVTDGRHGTVPGEPLRRSGPRFLIRRRQVLGRLAGWSLVESAQTFLFGFALARALDDGFLRGAPAVGIGWLAAAAVCVGAGAYGTARVYGAVADLVEPLRDSLVRKVVRRALYAPDGAAVSRLTHQVEIARDTFAGLVLVSRSFVFVTAGALIGLCSLAPVLLLLVLPPLLLGLALFGWALRPMARRQETFLAADEAIAAETGAALGGLRDITAAGAERTVADATGERFDAEQRASAALARWSMCRVLALGISGRLPIVLLLLGAPWLLGRGVTPGALVGALAYLTQSLLPALQSLMHGLGTSGTRLGVVLRRLTAEPATRPDGARPHRTPHRGTAVELSGVTFAYGPHADPVFRDLDLSVPDGGHLAIVGPSGIGKSTLAGLVAGLLEPGSGEVRRPAVADRVLVPQEAYVFSGTVRENVRYLCTDGRDGSDADLLAAAEKIGAGALLARLGGPDGTLVPSELSAGERQLIALVRAYLAPAPLVVLDEATCHLDPAAEARAERAFAARPGGTLIVVAHRISSALRADRVLVMDGTHARTGRHGDLLRRSALYRELTGGWAHEGPDGAAGAAPLQPAFPARDADGVDAVAGSRLAGDGGHVVAHGPGRQMQDAGDLGDRGALGGQ
ncbi:MULTISPECIES: ATP-binding cassette domain-containing protein [Streptomyces]|uniref:ABC transporter ATP-binding protein n=2 Tax=Streptomyces rimosus subsp. rimosus TaxID=132474 RepID=L8EP14_STRR1|nr:MULTISPECIES: ABC transporter ATP-binding protein [Streptomyces]KOG84091.1 ABC transporter ATP-binding protein [Kitasatospora aureofaciens]MYT46431.1 ATP-binding cassette domain-containing protein [Streptomyces sp. SID5471]KEF07530.1 ABC transporter ATP-binding protein [Streptomyces rimosus]KOT79868.1 ABC transporter ATP-binding protein [Streptomyces rimosus subsp. rimosus]KUJ43371.1 ABC transporter ATP-binding protein [Streptomyces rimosus subsp. rimosus]